ncbi:hypothetical protein KZZ52_52280 [Dactylosporangium sp. AC04546]|uniref:hypothetical protein n=1 Tax=Dactylosporangium sp. AC04546 TaxID=2862460 RepID=UPI001EDCD276|nr:hypothetical protein [Dactylosporangium sp. AC04546]WVK82441.1 hypothetical protein KZZ52_52280 [Dactylosporangium sp. AC04546]
MQLNDLRYPPAGLVAGLAAGLAAGLVTALTGALLVLTGPARDTTTVTFVEYGTVAACQR